MWEPINVNRSTFCKKKSSKFFGSLLTDFITKIEVLVIRPPVASAGGFRGKRRGRSPPPPPKNQKIPNKHKKINGEERKQREREKREVQSLRLKL